jgi:Zn-dependent protease with chaperone function
VGKKKNLKVQINYNMFNFAKILIFFGLILILLGLFFILIEKIPYLGKLPGDIYIKKGNFVFYFPLATSIILSILLTIILNLISRRK